MSHPFGDLLSQFLHRKHGLSQAKLAAGIFQSPSIVTDMCRGRRLSGRQARERVVSMLRWMYEQKVIELLAEANALLAAAGMAGLTSSIALEAQLAGALQQENRSGNATRVLPSSPNGPARRNNLPRQVTSFVGRGGDLDALTRLVEHAPLITLIGAGGVGKTRLAQEFAHRSSVLRKGGGLVCSTCVDCRPGIGYAIRHAIATPG